MALTPDQKTLVAPLLRLARALAAAEEVRWERPTRPRDRDEEVRPPGAPSDPTATIALDEARMEVSDAVTEAETLLRQAYEPFLATTDRLATAVTGWESRA